MPGRSNIWIGKALSQLGDPKISVAHINKPIESPSVKHFWVLMNRLKADDSFILVSRSLMNGVWVMLKCYPRNCVVSLSFMTEKAKEFLLYAAEGM